jgi:hypothetical protein
MRRKETFRLCPPGFGIHKEEWFRLSILDMTVPPNYNTYAIIFSGDHTDKTIVIDTFRRGILSTLGQCRHLVGTIEKNEKGDYSIVKKPTSTVDFVVQWLDDPEDEYPSYDDLEKADFTLATLGDSVTLGIKDLSKSCNPDDSPVVVGFQLNLIKGGFIFTVHVHHFALDMTGTTSLVKQIADNCYSALNNTTKPNWDEALMDRSRFTAPDVALEDQSDPLARPERHPDWLPCSWLLFHLPPSKCAQLKLLMEPPDNTRISTYDALVALLWRVLARNRAKIYSPDLASVAIFGEPINMRNRCESFRTMIASQELIQVHIRHTEGSDKIPRQRFGSRAVNASEKPSHFGRGDFRGISCPNSPFYQGHYQ